jgi:hypothetical protein
LRRENLSEGQASFSPVRVMMSSFAIWPPKEWDGRSIDGGGGKGNLLNSNRKMRTDVHFAYSSIPGDVAAFQ